MKIDLKSIAFIAIVAYVAVWGGNYALNAAGLSAYKA